MDASEQLLKIRQAIANREDAEASVRFTELDDWLCCGGLLPDEWQRLRKDDVPQDN